MRTAAAEAIEFEEMISGSPARQLETDSRFEVVTGGGLDARVRAGVSSEFLARVKMVIAAAVLLFRAITEDELKMLPKGEKIANKLRRIGIMK